MAKVCQSPHQGVGHQDVHIEIPECAKRADIQIQTCGMGKNIYTKIRDSLRYSQGPQGIGYGESGPGEPTGTNPIRYKVWASK